MGSDYLFSSENSMSGIFSVGRLILMESLYFYNFLYDSFIYSMLDFIHTDR